MRVQKLLNVNTPQWFGPFKPRVCVFGSVYIKLSGGGGFLFFCFLYGNLESKQLRVKRMEDLGRSGVTYFPERASRQLFNKLSEKYLTLGTACPLVAVQIGATDMGSGSLSAGEKVLCCGALCSSVPHPRQHLCAPHITVNIIRCHHVGFDLLGCRVFCLGL